MNYAQATGHLDALVPELAPAHAAPPRKFDLNHMRILCAALGDPQDLVPSVLIAGTNGKGSTAATLASILSAAGYRTGLYTSPHLSRVNERIQLAHAGTLTQISDEDFALLYTRVHEAALALVAEGRLPWPPSFFERLTALAFLYFAGHGSRSAAEIVVLEVGLGGRLDATNVVQPLISILTDIALDHQAYLGDTVALIAREKAGILRPNGTLITLSQHPEANHVIGEVASSLNVTAIDAAPYLPPAIRNQAIARVLAADTSGPALLPHNSYSIVVNDGTEPGVLPVDSPLPGEHQRRNLALAIAAAIHLRNRDGDTSGKTGNCNGYTITNASIAEGIRKTHWPARLEFLPPNLLLDVAHNPAGAWTLRAALGSLAPERPRTLIFSCLRDKSLEEIAGILFPLFDASGSDPLRSRDHIVLAPIPNARAATLEQLELAALALGIPACAAPDLAGALAKALQVTPEDGLIVATGSIYLAGEIRRLALTATGIAP